MNKKTIKINFKTFGCRMNQAESAILKSNFNEKGFLETDDLKDCDILVINTCTVTEKADQEIYRLIRKTKRENPEIKIALTGCLTETEKEKLLEFPNVKWVAGNENKFNLPEIILASETSCIISDIDTSSFKINGSAASSSRTRVNIKIQDGCSNFCSYCIIPFTRGKPRSRDFNDILKECRELIRKGYKELILTGINLGIYKNKNKSLIDLLKEILALSDNFRIRISSMEPGNILQELIDLMSKEKRICPFLHISVQSGSDLILKKMKRRYQTNFFSKLVINAFQSIPHISIGTDIITGFPGESEKLFNETLAFLKELPLSYFHVFSYSERKGTASASMKEQVPEESIKQRSRILRELSCVKRSRFLGENINQIREVLFEEKQNNLWQGTSDNYIKLLVKSDENIKNQLLPVRIIKACKNKAYGELLMQ